MRIIAGSLKGRQLASPHGHRTHPMSEKIRGAMFNALGDVEGLTFLDAFAGSGALAIEAISRGAKHVTAIEIDKKAHSVILQNVEALGIKNLVKATRANASGWSDHNPDARFDVVLLAPPYDNLQINTLIKLTRHVNKNGILVLDWPGQEALPIFDGFKIVSNKNYGDAQLEFYKK